MHIVAGVIFVLHVASTVSVADIRFADVTATTGINYIGESWGSSWGDFNSDGLPDLWLSNHNSCPSLYINQGNGRFTDVLPQVISDDLCSHSWLDSHGAAWADFDNDGDEDLIQLFDAAPTLQLRANRLYVNEGGVFTNKAADYGVANNGNRGRMPTWVDYNADGLLDLIIPTSYTNLSQVPTKLFEQTKNGGFTDTTQAVGFVMSASTNTVQLGDLDGDGSSELIPEVSNRFPLGVYDTSTVPFVDRQSLLSLKSTSFVKDVTIGDFNGDLLNDMLLVTGEKENDIVIYNPTTIRARLSTLNNVALNNVMGFEFAAGDEITIGPHPAWRWSKSKIFIGSTGIHPAKKTFTLSKNDPNVTGMVPFIIGVDSGLYVGFDEVKQKWVVRVTNSRSTNLVVTSNVVITGMVPYGVDLNLDDTPNKYLVNQSGHFLEETFNAGFSVPTSGRDIISADLDNDMDLDIYIVTTGAVNNLPNILYENIGNGSFVIVPNAGGAAGSSLGRGDTVSTADYDLDGFIDLVVTNGKSKEPFDEDGPVEVFKNLGNNNNWLDIDLEGIKSNREGIGAKVVAVAGEISQIRYQTGGIHYRTQNHSRIHFGLAQNQTVDLTIDWPSGVQQTLTDITVNQVLHVLEPVSNSLTGKPASASVPDETGVMLWKDTFDGPYQLIVKGGGNKTTFSVKLLSTKPFTSLSTSSLEANDVFDVTASSFSLDAVVSIGDERLKFTLPGGAKALVSVENLGLINPRQMHVGDLGDALTPAGWIFPYSQLPPLPVVVGGAENAQYLGRHNGEGGLSIRLNSDKIARYSTATVISSEPLLSSAGINIEPNDTVIEESRSVYLRGKVSSWWDGLDITVDATGFVGIATQHEDIFQSNIVNPNEGSLGEPNAYWLPLAEPYGEPVYEVGTDAGIYLWKNKNGAWTLRVSSLHSGRVAGTITSNVPLSQLIPTNLEPGDVVDSVGTELYFDFETVLGDEDEISFSLPVDAVINFNLNSPFSHKALVRVGEKKWPIKTLPLNLSGWE